MNSVPLILPITSIESISTSELDNDVNLMQDVIVTLKTLLEHTEAYIYIKDKSGQYIYVNQLVQELFAVPNNEIIGKSDEFFFDLELANEIRLNDRQVIDNGKTIEVIESTVIKATGEARFFQSVKKPVYNSQNKIIGMCGISTDITKLKKTEKQLENTVSVLNATLESTNDALLVVDLNNFWVFYNKPFVELWCLPDEIIYANNDSAALSYVLDQLEAPEVFLNKVQELYSTPDVSSYDILKFKNGKVIERFSIPQRIGGNVVGRVWNFHDITVQSQTLDELSINTEKLKVQENVFRTLVENTPNTIARYDTSFRRIYVNPALIRDIGKPLDEIIGKTPLEGSVKSSDLAAYQEKLKKVLGEGVIDSFLLEWKNGDGEDVYTDILLVPEKDTNGNILSILAIGQDITKRKIAEDALVHSETLFRSYFNLPLIGIAITSIDKGWMQVNQRLCDIFGYSKEELQSLTWVDITHPDDIAIDVAEFERVLSGDSDGYSLEKRFIQKGGATIFASISVACVRKVDAQCEYFVALVQDITEKKIDEQQRLADEASHREVLVREVHHRIKNNLQGVAGLLNDFSVKHPQFSELINEAVSQVHTISLIHGLQGRTSHSEVLLCELVQEISRNNSLLWKINVNVEMPKNQIRFKIASIESVPLALALNELIANAIKHGDPEIGVNVTFNYVPSTGKLNLLITNSGQLPVCFQENQELISGKGLQLVFSLLPKKGVKISWTQSAGIVSTMVEFGPPIITLESEEIVNYDKF